MKNPLHQLVLLGFFCQGLSWDDEYLLPGVYAALWLACVFLGGRRPVVIGTLGESALLALGCAAGYYGGLALGKNTHFFIGHGLVLVQLSRLLRAGRLTRRERIYSLLIGIFHLGVGATFIFDYRFIPMFLAAAVLLPRALMQLEAEAFPAVAGGDGRSRRLGAGIYAGAVALTIVFFLAIPRGLLPGGLPFQRPAPPGRGTLAEAVMDPVRAAQTPPNQVLLQIEGEDIGYLQCFALPVFNADSQTWGSSGRESLRELYYTPPEKLAASRHRRVRVKNVAFLGRALPVDGYVLKMEGKFFRRPVASSQGGVRCDLMWNTANNYYEYWMDPNPPVEELSPRQRDYLTRVPAPSTRLQQWLDAALKGVPDDPLAQARALEAHFRARFKYNAGAPALNRLNALEEFVLDQREGHCERFASALALLLRQKGVPTRVMVGYLPSSRNWMSGWINVRFKDAHAWTQAHIPGLGWVDLDATPAASLPAADPPLAELLDTVDFVWNAFVVNFDAPAQHQLFAMALEFVMALPDTLREQTALALLLGAAVALLIYWRQIRDALVFRRSPARRRHQSQVFAGHQYGRMLRALARRGFERPQQQTPLEFLVELRRRAFPALEDAGLVTELFCATRYGEHPLSGNDQHALEQAARRIEQWRPDK